MTKIQYTNNDCGGMTSFSIATIIVSLLYILPQTVVFITNDKMAIIVTIYYSFFVSKYVSPLVVLKVLLISLPYLFIYYFNNFLGNFKLGFVLPFMTLWTLIMPCFAAIAIYKRNNPSEQKTVLVFIGLSLLYVSVSTFRALALDPVIMREMAGGDEKIVMPARLMGVGGFGIAYGMGALLIAMWALRIYFRKPQSRHILYMMATIGCGLMVVMSQYATLFFITIFGIAIYYVLEANNIWKKIGILLFAIIAVYASQTFVLLGASLFEGQVLESKFQMIYDGIWGGAGAENISGIRSQYQLDAFSLFINSPIIGYEGAVNTKAFMNSHSEILGIMAATGLIGILSYLGCFVSAIMQTIKSCFKVRKEKILYYPVLLFYLAFAFLNPISYVFECAWIIFFVIPLFYFKVFNSKLYIWNK